VKEFGKFVTLGPIGRSYEQTQSALDKK